MLSTERALTYMPPLLRLELAPHTDLVGRLPPMTTTSTRPPKVERTFVVVAQPALGRPLLHPTSPKNSAFRILREMTGSGIPLIDGDRWDWLITSVRQPRSSYKSPMPLLSSDLP
ncbi:hypothetical protein V1517DRAFT_348851 [Lipomyces orientalis]|uniref:Uncharacterized protein n=1 Tax=Lipomyces orientalis TaxID=1233043 RepID=A0ACC3TFP5_9ASCO